MADSKDITLKIDDRDVTVPPGTLVIEAARRMGIKVPSFCYYPGLSLQAACRMCLVEVEKAPKMQTACTLVAMPGMVVRTGTEQVHQARKAMLEFLLANHPLDCAVCDKGGECELQEMVRGDLLRRAALHPVFPLRPRVRRGHGRQGARRRPARLAIGDHPQRGGP